MHPIDLSMQDNPLYNLFERFVVKSQQPYKANMRCPICGDSQKSKQNVEVGF